jgi:hypothetical protein
MYSFLRSLRREAIRRVFSGNLPTEKPPSPLELNGTAAFGQEESYLKHALTSR